MKLFVSNFPFTTTERELHDKFSEVGSVEGVRLITDQASGKPKGFGFVTMATEAEGHTAMEALNGIMFGGRTLRVEEAKARSSRPGQYRNDDRGDRGRDRGHRDRAPRESRW